jgi:hypothetical protein
MGNTVEAKRRPGVGDVERARRNRSQVRPRCWSMGSSSAPVGDGREALPARPSSRRRRRIERAASPRCREAPARGSLLPYSVQASAEPAGDRRAIVKMGGKWPTMESRGRPQHLSGAVPGNRTCLCRRFEAKIASNQESQHHLSNVPEDEILVRRRHRMNSLGGLWPNLHGVQVVAGSHSVTSIEPRNGHVHSSLEGQGLTSLTSPHSACHARRAGRGTMV